jgi:hypothetical protein
MALTGVARSWLSNLPEGTIYNWDQLYAMFIENFLGTAETLKKIKHKPDRSLWEYVKCFCNTGNAIPYIQEIKIINTFRDGVSNTKTVKEIDMKKPKTVANLLVVTDICIKATEA